MRLLVAAFAVHYDCQRAVTNRAWPIVVECGKSTVAQIAKPNRMAATVNLKTKFAFMVTPPNRIGKNKVRADRNLPQDPPDSKSAALNVSSVRYRTELTFNAALLESGGSWGRFRSARTLFLPIRLGGVTMKANFVFRLTVAAILLGFAIWATVDFPHSTTMGHARLVTAL